MMPDMWNIAEPLGVECRQSICQSSDQSNSSKKEIEKQPYGEEIEGQGGITNQVEINFDSRREVKGEVAQI